MVDMILLYLVIGYVVLDRLFFFNDKISNSLILCYSTSWIPLSFILYYSYYGDFMISLVTSLFFASFLFAFKVIVEYLVRKLTNKRYYLDLMYFIQIVVTYKYLLL